jgi:hypothetical protein
VVEAPPADDAPLVRRMSIAAILKQREDEDAARLRRLEEIERNRSRECAEESDDSDAAGVLAS